MSSFFAAALHGLGLSQSEAAHFLSVRPDTIKSWSSGRRSPPEGALAALHALAAAQQNAADQAVTIARKAVKDDAEIELSLAKTDEEARHLGWPCAGAQLAVFRRIWEGLPPTARVVIVERDSPALAASVAT